MVRSTRSEPTLIVWVYRFGSSGCPSFTSRNEGIRRRFSVIR
jgi:hypothetical protein